MAKGDVAPEALDDIGLVEVVANQAEPALGMKVLAIVSDDAGRFLAPMLQSVQAKRRQRGGILVAEDTKDAALLAQAVVIRTGQAHTRRGLSV